RELRGEGRRRRRAAGRPADAPLRAQPVGPAGAGRPVSALERRQAPMSIHPSSASLADVLERVLDKGVVIAGDVVIELLDIELLTLKLRLLIASADTAKSMGIDWWEHDPALSSNARELAARDVEVGELLHTAEAEARAEVADRLRRLFADDLLRRALAALEPAGPAVGLAGITEENGALVPIVLELDRARLRDTGELEAAARAHNELLLGREAVLPFRFGTAFENREALDEWVQAHEPELRAELERMRGTEEWGVEVLAPAAAAPGEGGYLEQRLAAGVATTERARLAERCRQRLAAAALEANGDSYLVADGAAFEAVLAALTEEGVELRVTGPWPPYSFARLP